MKNYLIVVDMQNDFIDGALGTAEAVAIVDKVAEKIRGFDGADALFAGIESRTSSPVRITRGEDGQAIGIAGLYPCGEGAGYAGGIMSAAMDGIRTARKFMTAYSPCEGGSRCRRTPREG